VLDMGNPLGVATCRVLGVDSVRSIWSVWSVNHTVQYIGTEHTPSWS